MRKDNAHSSAISTTLKLTAILPRLKIILGMKIPWSMTTVLEHW